MASQKRRSCTKTEPYKQNQKMRTVSRLSYTEGAHARLDAEAAGEKPSRAERGRGGVRAATAPSCPHPREHPPHELERSPFTSRPAPGLLSPTPRDAALTAL